MIDAPRYNPEAQNYNNARAFINNVVGAKELGYIYTFPDKRTYRPVGNPTEFITKAWEGYKGQVGLYVHTPFCTPKTPPPEVSAQMQDRGIKIEGRDHLCAYCNLFTTVGKKIPPGYTEDAIAETQLYRDLFSGRKLEASSVYFGGGTPTMLSPEDIGKAYRAVESIIGRFPDNIERAIETAPDIVDRATLGAIRNVGFNRVSVGVQTFDEDVLHYSGRAYDPMLGYRAVEDAKAVGFDDVNVDIIMGLPASSKKTFMQDIAIVRKLAPTTVTLYQDATRPITRFGKMQAAGILPTVSSEDIYAWTDEADQLLKSDGYERQSLTAWGKNGGKYKQGEDIYSGIPILGIGAGARSHAPNGHYSTEYTVNTRLTQKLIGDWRNNVRNGRFNHIHGIEMTPDLKVRERAVLGLMAPVGVSTAELQGRFQTEFQALKDAGMIERQGTQWKYTEQGKTYSGALAKLFFGKEIEDRLVTYEHL